MALIVCFSTSETRFATEYFRLPMDPGYKSYSCFLNSSQSSVLTASWNFQSSCSSLGAYRMAQSMVCFAVKLLSSANHSTSSRNMDSDVGFPSNLGAEWWFLLGIGLLCGIGKFAMMLLFVSGISDWNRSKRCCGQTAGTKRGVSESESVESTGYDILSEDKVPSVMSSSGSR